MQKTVCVFAACSDVTRPCRKQCFFFSVLCEPSSPPQTQLKLFFGTGENLRLAAIAAPYAIYLIDERTEDRRLVFAMHLVHKRVVLNSSNQAYHSTFLGVAIALLKRFRSWWACNLVLDRARGKINFQPNVPISCGMGGKGSQPEA
jgi:hypothetical protein